MGTAALILLIADFGLHLGWSRHKVLTKCLLMPILAAFYLLQAAVVEPLVPIALLLGCIGDFMLTRPDSKIFFQFGMIAFLGGHLAYAAAFIRSTGNLRGVPGWFFSVVVIYLLMIIWLFLRLKSGLAHFKPQFLIYCAAICLMSLMALARVFALPFVAFLLPFVGSLLFMVSDSLLACGQFGKPVRHSELLVMSSYVAAQVLIVSGFLI